MTAENLPMSGRMRTKRNVRPTTLFNHVMRPFVTPSAIGYVFSHASS